MSASFEISGHFVDVIQGEIYPAKVSTESGKITSIQKVPQSQLREDAPYIMPGLVDAHVHIESSMLLPSEFGRMAVVHGTVATVSDPHEIANVLGIEGVRFMVEDGKRVPFKFYFGAPSCVPATTFETAGAEIAPDGIEELLASDDIVYLAEMMNFPGVLFEDPVVMEKIAIAKKAGKPIDGHAPGLRGDKIKQYASAGISTDHECFTLEEGQDKLEAGMKVIIREGSAAKNFEALIPLLKTDPERIMFCSDDKHPNDLELGHINQLLARAVAKGNDPITAIRAATLNPVEHYGLKVGLGRTGDPADLISVKDLESFEVLNTWIDGVELARNGSTLLPRLESAASNKFNCDPVETEQLKVKQGSNKLRCIIVDDGQIVTRSEIVDLPESEFTEANTETDLLKLVVYNRYQKAAPAVAFVRGFDLKTGALASSVAHDSHNIIATGVDDISIAKAINQIVKHEGGISLVGDEEVVLPLPVAGLMSLDDGWKVARQYDDMDRQCKKQGCSLTAPYMSLSFLALLVIPELKLSDKGLFDGSKFEFADLFIRE